MNYYDVMGLDKDDDVGGCWDSWKGEWQGDWEKEYGPQNGGYNGNGGGGGGGGGYSNTGLAALAASLYSPGDTVDDLVAKMLSAINSGGGGIISVWLTPDQYKLYLEALGYQVGPGNTSKEYTGILGTVDEIKVLAEKPERTLVTVDLNSEFGLIGKNEKIYGVVTFVIQGGLIYGSGEVGVINYIDFSTKTVHTYNYKAGGLGKGFIPKPSLGIMSGFEVGVIATEKDPTDLGGPFYSVSAFAAAKYGMSLSYACTGFLKDQSFTIGGGAGIGAGISFHYGYAYYQFSFSFVPNLSK